MQLAWVRVLDGPPVDDLCERRAWPTTLLATLSASPERVAAERLLWRGDLVAPRALERAAGLADKPGEPTSYAMVRLHLCELELR